MENKVGEDKRSSKESGKSAGDSSKDSNRQSQGSQGPGWNTEPNSAKTSQDTDKSSNRHSHGSQGADGVEDPNAARTSHDTADSKGPHQERMSLEKDHHEEKEDDTPKILDVTQLPAPEDARLRLKRDAKNFPVAAKVVFLKKPEEPVKVPPPPGEVERMSPKKKKGVPSTKAIEPEKAHHPHTKQETKKDQLHGIKKPMDIGLPMLLLTDTVTQMIKDTDEDKLIDQKLSALIESHRGDLLEKLKKKEKQQYPNYTFNEMVDMLKEQGIPCPTDADFARLHGFHSRWDPDGTVIEYFSPMLRTFIPINMRGRYRGCWTTDDCIKGLNISKVPPKRDALEGFVDRGRHHNIQEKYREMADLAEDEAHLDYLIEIQAYQAEALPIPLFYDILHLGIEVANENLRILVQENGYSPNDEIFLSSEDHAQQLRRKIQLYGALGLEHLESKRKGLGRYDQKWLKTRDEVIRGIMKRKDAERYTNLQRMEEEAAQRTNSRREQSDFRGPAKAPAPVAHTLPVLSQPIKKNSGVEAPIATVQVNNSKNLKTIMQHSPKPILKPSMTEKMRNTKVAPEVPPPPPPPLVSPDTHAFHAHMDQNALDKLAHMTKKPPPKK